MLAGIIRLQPRPYLLRLWLPKAHSHVFQPLGWSSISPAAILRHGVQPQVGPYDSFQRLALSIVQSLYLDSSHCNTHANMPRPLVVTRPLLSRGRNGAGRNACSGRPRDSRGGTQASLQGCSSHEREVWNCAVAGNRTGAS